MKFALAGNPNSGKTTLFNALTGSTAHVGNWPGVTVDQKTGVYKKLPERAEIVDLPGIYSISPYTPEEIVTRNFLLEERPDCIINIVDATNIERNLYLTTQLMELDIPVVVALNMMDEVKKSGDEIDSDRLSQLLGVDVAEISALRGTGIVSLMTKVYASAKGVRKGASAVAVSPYLQNILPEVQSLYPLDMRDIAFRAVKLLEDDGLEREQNPDLAIECARIKDGVDTGIFEGDFEALVADARYKYITEHLGSAFMRKNSGELKKSDKIDRVLTHKIWGIPIFLLIMLGVFHLTFSDNLLFLGAFIPEGSFSLAIIGEDSIASPGMMLFNAMELLTETISGAVAGVMPAGTWYTGLLCDGLLAGLFAVLSFIPQILCLFLFLSILEDTGYMARVAFLMDRAFRKFGLSGRAFMPLLMCFGCAVPGIMATRTLANEQERRRTILLTPFFSCGAKLPIWAAFAGVFAQAYTGLNAELVVYSMYLIGIVVAIVAALFLKGTFIKGEAPTFIMELPAYHLPQAKNLILHLWDKLKHYLFRAGTVIAGSIVVIWFLSNFSFAFRFVEDSGLSMMGVVARGISFLFVPLGFGMGADGWKFVVAAFTGLIAKEMVVATMGTFAGGAADSVVAESALGGLMLGIGGTLGGLDIAIPAMFAFMTFNLLSIPCMSAVGAANGEFRKKRHLFGALAFWLVTSYIVSAFVFWFGVLAVYNGWIAFGVGLAIVALIAVSVVLKRKGFFGSKKHMLTNGGEK